MTGSSNWYLRFGKRGFDLTMAAGLIVLFAPLLAGLSLLVWWKHGAPVVFCQSRPGREGRIFDIYKFRTMTNQRGTNGELLSDEARLTAFGRWLRSTSLDELPELWNILRGDMSFVGPRPLLVSYLPLYTPEQARRHELRPGLTGWAQIHGRNATTWEERFARDIWYVENCSFWLDLRILFATVFKVIQRDGISSTNEATMSEFKGTAARLEVAAPTRRAA